MKRMLSFILILVLAFSMASVPGIAGASSTVKRELIRFSSYANTDTDCDLFGFYVGDGNSAKTGKIYEFSAKPADINVRKIAYSTAQPQYIFLNCPLNQYSGKNIKKVELLLGISDGIQWNLCAGNSPSYPINVLSCESWKINDVRTITNSDATGFIAGYPQDISAYNNNGSYKKTTLLKDTDPENYPPTLTCINTAGNLNSITDAIDITEYAKGQISSGNGDFPLMLKAGYASWTIFSDIKLLVTYDDAKPPVITVNEGAYVAGQEATFSADIKAVGDANTIETVKFTFDGNEFEAENNNGTYSATVLASAMTAGEHTISWEATDANGTTSTSRSAIMVAGKQVLDDDSLDITKRIFAFRYTTRDADNTITADGLWDLNNLSTKSNNGAVRVDSYSKASVEMWGSYDLSSIPSDKRVVKAEIVLGLYEPSNNPNPTLGIYEVLGTFEQNITENIPNVASEAVSTAALQKALASEGVKTAKGFRSIVNDGYPEHLTDFDTVIDITSLVDEYMDDGKTELNICIKGISTAQNFAKNPQILLTYADKRSVEATVTKVGDKHKFTALFTGDKADEPVVIFAVYNGNNLIEAVIADNYNAEIAELPNEFTYKCFVWNSIDTCIPLIEAYSQTYTE